MKGDKTAKLILLGPSSEKAAVPLFDYKAVDEDGKTLCRFADHNEYLSWGVFRGGYITQVYTADEVGVYDD